MLGEWMSPWISFQPDYLWVEAVRGYWTVYVGPNQGFSKHLKMEGWGRISRWCLKWKFFIQGPPAFLLNQNLCSSGSGTCISTVPVLQVPLLDNELWNHGRVDWLFQWKLPQGCGTLESGRIPAGGRIQGSHPREGSHRGCACLWWHLLVDGNN